MPRLSKWYIQVDAIQRLGKMPKIAKGIDEIPEFGLLLKIRCVVDAQKYLQFFLKAASCSI